MRVWLLSAAGAALAVASACAPTAKTTYTADAAMPTVARGHFLVRLHCDSCHAPGQLGPSPLSAAPPLRDLHRRYEPSALGEALAEGIMTGHPAMPQFQFSASDGESIIIYLDSIQSR